MIATYRHFCCFTETQGFVNLLFRTLETQKYDAEPAPVQVQASIPVKNTASTEFELRDTYSSTTAHEEVEKKTTKEPVYIYYDSYITILITLQIILLFFLKLCFFFWECFVYICN